MLTSPTWLASLLTCLQTLHLENCGKWQRLPLGSLGLLRKLVLIEMENATEVSIPSLEELVFIDLLRLKTCYCSLVRDLNFSLRFLNIKGCPMLEVFPLFEDCLQFEIERTSCMPRLSKVTIHDCPCLHMHNPIPLSTTVSELSIIKVSTLPMMEGSSNEMLRIGHRKSFGFCKDSEQLIALDDKVLSFHNLRFLTNLEISGCKNLTTISFEGLRQLTCLKNLTIHWCPKLLSSIDSSELTSEDMAGANRSNLPPLESLDIADCGITRKWLSLMLQHVQFLRELSLKDCEQITGLSIGEEENSRSNLMLVVDAQSGRPSRDKILHLPLNLIPSLKKVAWASDFTLHGMKEGFAKLTSLEKLYIEGDCYLDSDLAYNDGNDEHAKGRWFLPLSLEEIYVHQYSLETLKPCFPSHLTSLKKLKVIRSTSLKSLELQSCTTLEELDIDDCPSLSALEGLQSIHGLRRIQVFEAASLTYLELQSCTALEELIAHYVRGLAIPPQPQAFGTTRLPSLACIFGDFVRAGL
uniref:NB-ARC domain-containing protein n=1 Tax=Leersia perrieri TaxID=77586 RepID=A0A0D9W9N8_9ORYZ